MLFSAALDSMMPIQSILWHAAIQMFSSILLVSMHLKKIYQTMSAIMANFPLLKLSRISSSLISDSIRYRIHIHALCRHIPTPSRSSSTAIAACLLSHRTFLTCTAKASFTTILAIRPLVPQPWSMPCSMAGIVNTPTKSTPGMRWHAIFWSPPPTIEDNCSENRILPIRFQRFSENIKRIRIWPLPSAGDGQTTYMPLSIGNRSKTATFCSRAVPYTPRPLPLQPFSPLHFPAAVTVL